jgi:poly(A) polymerase
MAARARTAAVEIVRTLRREGHVAYFAGGCVRDELLGLDPADYDIATDAVPDRLRELFPRANEVGAAFGVMLVRRHEETVEVATFREESGYSDKRRPDEVRFADAERDARRRDFTINALFLDPLTREPAPEGLASVAGAVIDLVGGLADLRNGVVRAVGDPEVRLSEDHLRALRAARFAARFGFHIDGATADAIRRHAGELAGVSRERIGEELRRMLAPATRAEAVRHIEALGLDAPALDDGPVGHTPTERCIDRLPVGAGFGLALAAWALDRLHSALGAPAPAERIRREAGAIATRWRAALCMSNLERDEMAGALETLARLELDWPAAGEAARKRLAASHWFGQALDLLGARDEQRAAAVEAEVRELQARHGGVAPVPLLAGDALVALGFPPGPRIGVVLDRVYDAQLEGRVTTESEALALARSLWDEGAGA